MISTGMTGTARHGTSPNSARAMRVKTLTRRAPPLSRMAARARAICGACGGSPAAVLALTGADIGGDLPLEFRLAAPEIVLQHDEFGGYRGVGLELEYPMPVGVLQRHQRFAGAVYGRIQPRR